MQRNSTHFGSAHVIAVIALFVALGGTGYAATKISGSTLKARSVSGGKLIKRTITRNEVKTNTLTGAQILESSLGRVPRAGTADKAANADKALTAGSAATAANAANADKIDGVDSADLARGAVATQAGSASVALGGTATVFQAGGLGTFELSCPGGTSGADIRYRNTGGATADVWRTYVADTSTKTLYDAVAAGDDKGTAFPDPNRLELNVGRDGKLARFTATSHFAGASGCRFAYEMQLPA